MNEKHPFQQVDEVITARAAANLSNLEYWSSLDGELITSIIEYEAHKHNSIAASLEALGLKKAKLRALESGDDCAINRIPPDKNNSKNTEEITELRLSRSGARRLAEKGVKSEVLQTFIPMEERDKSFVRRV
jgi:hypothetical protein